MSKRDKSADGKLQEFREILIQNSMNFIFEPSLLSFQLSKSLIFVFGKSFIFDLIFKLYSHAGDGNRRERVGNAGPGRQEEKRHDEDGNAHDLNAASCAQCGQREISNFLQNFTIFWRALSRLYQNEILQENTRLTAFFRSSTRFAYFCTAAISIF